MAKRRADAKPLFPIRISPAMQAGAAGGRDRHTVMDAASIRYDGS